MFGFGIALIVFGFLLAIGDESYIAGLILVGFGIFLVQKFKKSDQTTGITIHQNNNKPLKGKTITSSVAGLYYHKASVIKILTSNPDATTDGGGKEGAVIYKYYPFKGQCKLVPETSNKHDRHAIKIMCNGYHIGYIPKDETYLYHPIIKRSNYESVVSIKSGPYIMYKNKKWVEMNDQNFSGRIEINY